MRCVAYLTACVIQKAQELVCKIAAHPHKLVVVLMSVAIRVTFVALRVIAAARILARFHMPYVVVRPPAVLPVRPVVMPLKVVAVNLNFVILIQIVLAVRLIGQFLV
jgi:hypothetical protein